MKNKTTTINIQNEANIEAKGEFNSKHCKSVLCIETGVVYSSMTDAANDVGLSATNLSSHLARKQQTFGGKHYCFTSKVNESLDAIMACLREANTENERRKEDEEDAKKWRAYQAEQERIRLEEERRLEAERKAKEKHEADIVKADAKIERRKTICQRLQEQLTEANKRLAKAVEERAELDL